MGGDSLCFKDSQDDIIHWLAGEAEQMQTDRHPKKEIHAAIEYALERNWTFTKAGPRAHIYGTLYCPEQSREGCRVAVFSTPRSPQNHANQIRKRVDRCIHSAA